MIHLFLSSGPLSAAGLRTQSLLSGAQLGVFSAAGIATISLLSIARIIARVIAPYRGERP